MKVYAVVKSVDWDRDEVEAVFRDEASAQAFCGERAPENWRVEEWEVQDGTGFLPLT